MWSAWPGKSSRPTSPSHKCRPSKWRCLCSCLHVSRSRPARYIMQSIDMHGVPFDLLIITDGPLSVLILALGTSCPFCHFKQCENPRTNPLQRLNSDWDPCNVRLAETCLFCPQALWSRIHSRTRPHAEPGSTGWSCCQPSRSISSSPAWCAWLTPILPTPRLLEGSYSATCPHTEISSDAQGCRTTFQAAALRTCKSQQHHEQNHRCPMGQSLIMCMCDQRSFPN